MLTCRELVEIITDYIEGRLTLWQRLRIQFHLGMCGHCRTYLRQMRATRNALGSLPPVAVPAEVRDELLERFRQMKRCDSTNPSS